MQNKCYIMHSLLSRIQDGRVLLGPFQTKLNFGALRKQKLSKQIFRTRGLTEIRWILEQIRALQKTSQAVVNSRKQGIIAFHLYCTYCAYCNMDSTQTSLVNNSRERTRVITFARSSQHNLADHDGNMFSKGGAN